MYQEKKCISLNYNLVSNKPLNQIIPWWINPTKWTVLIKLKIKVFCPVLFPCPMTQFYEINYSLWDIYSRKFNVEMSITKRYNFLWQVILSENDNSFHITTFSKLFLLISFRLFLLIYSFSFLLHMSSDTITTSHLATIIMVMFWSFPLCIKQFCVLTSRHQRIQVNWGRKPMRNLRWITTHFIRESYMYV